MSKIWPIHLGAFLWTMVDAMGLFCPARQPGAPKETARRCMDGPSPKRQATVNPPLMVNLRFDQRRTHSGRRRRLRKRKRPASTHAAGRWSRRERSAGVSSPPTPHIGADRRRADLARSGRKQNGRRVTLGTIASLQCWESRQRKGGRHDHARLCSCTLRRA